MARISLPLAAAALALATLPASLQAQQVVAEAPPIDLRPKLQAAAPAAAQPVAGDVQLAQADDRRRPGEARPVPAVPPVQDLPIDPNAIPRPSPVLPREFVPIPDRWRLIEAVGVKDNWWDPYNQNTLKGDRPLFDDWFINISAISDTVLEPRRVPVPVGSQTTDRAGSTNTFGKYRQFLFSQSFIASVSLIKGDTAYKPPDYEIRFSPVLNVNYADVQERAILFADPQRGTDRLDSFLGIQEAFVDYHIRNVSDRFDFDSLRAGVQPFSSDFRGFVFQDNQLGIRLFGNRDNNLWQYNLAYFRRIEKDTNSGLNDFGKPIREDDIFIANVYHQDFPVVGMTSQATFIHNRNDEGSDFYFDKNGFLVRPAPIGDQRGRNYRANYVGFNTDGHWGRFNVTGSFYYLFGTDDHNQFSGKKSDISAWFFALEPSIDFDWVRVRLSALYASGDDDPFDNKEGGFDAIVENPQFAGGDTSYWIRQGIPFIGGGGVLLTGRNSVLPALKSSQQGQSNFNNPGIRLIGIGTDFDLTPELRLSTNFNYLEFDDTSSLEFLRNQGSISREIGWDLSAALIYRPTFIQNIVFRLSGAVLFPGKGLKEIYDSSENSDLLASGRYLYSVLANVILTY